MPTERRGHPGSGVDPAVIIAAAARSSIRHGGVGALRLRGPRDPAREPALAAEAMGEARLCVRSSPRPERSLFMRVRAGVSAGRRWDAGSRCSVGILCGAGMRRKLALLDLIDGASRRLADRRRVRWPARADRVAAGTWGERPRGTGSQQHELCGPPHRGTGARLDELRRMTLAATPPRIRASGRGHSRGPTRGMRRSRRARVDVERSAVLPGVSVNNMHSHAQPLSPTSALVRATVRGTRRGRRWRLSEPGIP